MEFGTSTPSDARVQNFLKYETTISLTDPRNISPRLDRFLAIVGPYISAIDHAACKCEYLVKGLTPDDRALKLDHLKEREVFIETDYSRFDMTISFDWLRLVEYNILTSPFPRTEHELFHQAMRHTWSTQGDNEFDLRYQVKGGRCSGDAHTSIGNGLLNRFNTWLVLQNLPADSWTSFHEGDDGVIGIDEAQSADAINLLTIIESYGFKIKTVVSNRIEDITFCGRWMFPSGQRLYEMCDVPRALSKFHISLRQGKLQTLLLAKAMSYYYTDRNTPIIGELCYGLIMYLKPLLTRSALKRATQLSLLDRYCLRDSKWTTEFSPPEVPHDARIMLALRAGIDVPDQIALEKVLRDVPCTGIPASFTLTWPDEFLLEAADRRVIPNMDYVAFLTSNAS